MCAYRSMKFILCVKAALLTKEGAARAVPTVHMVHQGACVLCTAAAARSQKPIFWADSPHQATASITANKPQCQSYTAIPFFELTLYTHAID